MSKGKDFDIYKMITEKIISELEKGIVPWHRPWTGTTEGAFNRVTKIPYSLLNQMLLSKTGEYASFKQWQKLGGKIKKGAKSEVVVFWKVYKKTVKATDKEGNSLKDEDGNTLMKRKSIPLLRYYRVFHIDDIEGVEPLEDPFKDREIKPVESAENVISDYVTRSGIKFSEEKSNKAYYSPLLDKVVVPKKEQFASTNEWYSTTFHELTHSTGHKSRLDRFEDEKAAAFGSETYSKEELVAEMGSAFLMSATETETPDTFQNSTAYIQSWLSALKDDPKMIVGASSRAEKAVRLILNEEVKKTHREQLFSCHEQKSMI